MRLKITCFITFLLLANFVLSQYSPKVVCFYNSYTYMNKGAGKVTINDLEPVLSLCTHLIYGYARLDFESKRAVPRNLDRENSHYSLVTALKSRFPHLKILLGVGGQIYDKEITQQYHQILENIHYMRTYIQSVCDLVKNHGFDGINLAWEFPPIKSRKFRGTIGGLWYDLQKKVGIAGNPVDEKADEHRHEFTNLVNDIRSILTHENYLVTVTVLPNVNFSQYYDVQSIIDKLDFIVLSTFDYSTPGRNPKRADFSAPLCPLNDPDNRNSVQSVDSDVKWWLNNHGIPSKIIVGIPTFGRAWDLDRKPGEPPVEANGAAPGGPLTDVESLRSLPEICSKLYDPQAVDVQRRSDELTMVTDFSMRRGSYAYRFAGVNGEWISFEDPPTAGVKAAYVKSNQLGGIGIFYLDLDDAHGTCQDEKYPILKAAVGQLKDTTNWWTRARVSCNESPV